MLSIAKFVLVGLPAAGALLSVLVFIATLEVKFLLFAVVSGVCAALAHVLLKGVSSDAPGKSR